MTKAQRRYWQSQQQLGGYGTYGPGTKVVLEIGRRTGLDYNGRREGNLIPAGMVVDVIEKRRGKQVGQGDVGLTAVNATGRYKGGSEPSVNVELIWTQAKKEPKRADFFRNIKSLAQGIAGDLAQREVIVEWDAPGRRGRTDTATPPKAPSKTQAAAFCKWVREHSTSARENPSDDCFPKKGQRHK